MTAAPATDGKAATDKTAVLIDGKFAKTLRAHIKTAGVHLQGRTSVHAEVALTSNRLHQTVHPVKDIIIICFLIPLLYIIVIISSLQVPGHLIRILFAELALAQKEK